MTLIEVTHGLLKQQHKSMPNVLTPCTLYFRIDVSTLYPFTIPTNTQTNPNNNNTSLPIAQISLLEMQFLFHRSLAEQVTFLQEADSNDDLFCKQHTAYTFLTPKTIAVPAISYIFTLNILHRKQYKKIHEVYLTSIYTASYCVLDKHTHVGTTNKC